MKTLSEKITEQLQSKHDAFLGTEGELSRQRFKDGLMWAIDTIETLTYVDNCEKEHEAEQLRIAAVVKQSELFECRNVACNKMVKRNSGTVFCKKHN